MPALFDFLVELGKALQKFPKDLTVASVLLYLVADGVVRNYR
jgi:hypothetical protein